MMVIDKVKFFILCAQRCKSVPAMVRDAGLSPSVTKYIEAGKDQEGKGFDPRKLLAPGFDAIKAKVKEKMELFGSVGQA